ncbi:MAG: outer membrane beta-barrel protein [Steroidobacteraceae bacterium]
MSHSASLFGLSRLSQSLLATLAMGFAVTASAAAPAYEPAFEITPFAGYQAGGRFLDLSNDQGVSLNSSGSAALAINWRAADPGSQYELLYSRQATDVDSATPLDVKVEYLQLGGTTPLGDLGARVLPFAAGGFGATRITPDAAALSQETRWSFNLGGGVRIKVAPHVRLRFEARGYLTWLGGSDNLFCSGGCVIAGKSKTLFQYQALGGVSVGF